MTPRPRFLAPGDKLGKYDLIRQIAVGGMAELYLARTVGIEGFEKLVVVKRILPQFATNASFVNMFLNEARLAATLHHPNIAQVYDIGQEGCEYFFAMEYIHGEDLGRLVASATDNGVPISLDVALTLIAGLCAGLHYAHEKVGSDGKHLSVVHRDVSPSNVLVSYDGAVKLVDFGIARAGSQPSTTRGGIKGKIGYMSPEQCKGKETLDRRSDLFSVGALLYELTTGRLPFIDETEYGVLSQIVNTDAPPPSKLVPSYPPALEKIVLKALSRDRDRRYPSAIELQGDIEDFAHENRLRISPLVLARLMGTLFPTRLEEWDSARAQGAFFVEQHVVRTLIESGKTSDSALAFKAPPETQLPDEDTSISPPPAADNEPTNVQAPVPDMQRPRTPAPRQPTPPAASEIAEPPTQPFAPPLGSSLPTQPLPIARVPAARAPTPPPQPAARAPTPPPQPAARAPSPPIVHPPARAASPMLPPNAVPIVAPQPIPHTPQRAQSAPVGGTLVSSAGSYGVGAAPPPMPSAATLAVGDVTERVRVPTPHPSFGDTAQVGSLRPRSKLPIVLGLLVAGAIAAGIVVITGDDSSDPKTAASPSKADGEAAESKVVMEPEPAIYSRPRPPSKAESGAEPRPATGTEPASYSPAAPTAGTEAEPVIDKPNATPPEPTKSEPTKSEPAKSEPVQRDEPAVAVKTEKRPKKEPVKTVVKAEPRPKKEPAKPTKKPEPKEQAKWNADSPFMPVRPPEKK